MSGRSRSTITLMMLTIRNWPRTVSVRSAGIAAIGSTPVLVDAGNDRDRDSTGGAAEQADVTHGAGRQRGRVSAAPTCECEIPFGETAVGLHHEKKCTDDNGEQQGRGDAHRDREAGGGSGIDVSAQKHSQTWMLDHLSSQPWRRRVDAGGGRVETRPTIGDDRAKCPCEQGGGDDCKQVPARPRWYPTTTR